MKELFYTLDAKASVTTPAIPADLKIILWRPALTSVQPQGMQERTAYAWWLLHFTRAFSNRDYSVVAIYDRGRLVHRSSVFPRYFRFPFMGKDDLQIGDTWTDPNDRGREIAALALQYSVSAWARPGRRFWYIVEESNQPSIRVAEKCGFTCIAEGQRVPRFGIQLLGKFVMD